MYRAVPNCGITYCTAALQIQQRIRSCALETNQEDPEALLLAPCGPVTLSLTACESQAPGGEPQTTGSRGGTQRMTLIHPLTCKIGGILLDRTPCAEVADHLCDTLTH